MRKIYKIFCVIFSLFLWFQSCCFASNTTHLTDTQIIKKIKKLDKKIKRNPNNSKLLIQRGFMKFCLKDYGSALEDYTLAEDTEPNNSDIFYSKGRVWFEKGKYNFLSKQKSEIKLCPLYLVK